MNSILSPLYIAVSWIVVQFHSLYSLVFDEDSGWAWGLSIFSLVVVIRIALIPLFVKQIKATRNMQALQPRMKKIQERYKNDRQRQSEEMMKLYKETGTNPLASCLPILAQSPFFIALFQVLNHIASDKVVGVLNRDQVESAREATIFGAPIATRFMDSASQVAELGASQANVRIVTVIMIVLMSASQFFTQRQLMTKNVDLTVKTPFMNQQKMLMYIFPIMFAVFGVNFPVGVLIYWLTTNVWTLGQQMYVITRNPTPGSLAFQQRQERLRKKGKLPQEEEEAAKKSAEATRTVRNQRKRQTRSQRQSGTGAQPAKKQAASAPSRLDKPQQNGKSGGDQASQNGQNGQARSSEGSQPQKKQRGQQAKKSQARKPKPSAKSKK
ncbi:membrane protein insertase YidC [Streptomyces sp. 3MP-14]|uniref:Membrane protein insertase YidC n=1 Tax=Streptomyces mimosae TaxID=2586635 RepID=A0A5N6A6A0_9ACTN|nr:MULTISPECIES: membrane protein insertase YidC [Streptomyces]KAB8163469.1 membrane protein insertase YidC [Streptomyces mimosae]KAB8174747.1 membrane protein insertase YidC [Streptomyces sp. 3MP-14]